MSTSAGEPILHGGSTEAVGLVFCERMSGGFVLGESNPRIGERKGLAANSRFDLQATATITDLSRFLSAPQRQGELHGTVSFAALGSDLEMESGAIRLFRRTADPTLKLMEYCFTLRQGTKDYCLVGQKEIRRQRLLHGWSETTTLLCRLYEGPDTRGDVVGAGVLHLTFWEFLRQLSSFQVTNAPSGFTRAETLFRFLRFFAAELLDSYA